jgi:hypothetical protein
VLGGRTSQLYIPRTAHLPAPSFLPPTIVSTQSSHNISGLPSIHRYTLCKSFDNTSDSFLVLHASEWSALSTTSSSPSTSPTRQAAAYPEQLHERHFYRQKTYQNGAGLQIETSRRRSGVVRKVESPTRAYADFVLFPGSDVPPAPQSQTVEGFRKDPASRAFLAEHSILHVTSAKRTSRTGSKPVVIHKTSKSLETKPDTAKPSYQPFSDTTSPPTPRLARLATPDFSDPDEAPFCECDADAHVIRRCTSCNKEAVFRST